MCPDTGRRSLPAVTTHPMGWKQLRNKLVVPDKQVSRRHRDGCLVPYAPSSQPSLSRPQPPPVCDTYQNWPTLPFLKRSNTHVTKRIVGINAFHLKKRCFAFLPFGVSHPSPLTPAPHPFSRRTLVFLHCRNCALAWWWAGPGCLWTLCNSVTLHFRRAAPSCGPGPSYPYPMAEVFSRLEYRNVCVATWSLVRCLTWRAAGWTLLTFAAQLP